MQSALVVRPSPIHGVGVFAGRGYAPGETVLLLDDSRMVDGEHPIRPETGELPIHTDIRDDGTVVLQGVPDRYLNSSCDPNAFVQTRLGRRHLVARRPIALDEEITYDYVINLADGGPWRCTCRSSRCRGVQPRSFFKLPPEFIREYLPLLDQQFVVEHAERVAVLRRKLAAVVQR